MAKSEKAFICAMANYLGEILDKRLRSLVFTAFGHFSNDSMFLVYPLLITYYALVPGVSIVLLGYLAVVYELIYGLLSFPIGRIADRMHDEGALIALGIFLLGLAMAAFAASFAFRAYMIGLILVGVLLLGSGTAFYHPMGASVLRKFYKSRAPTVMGVNGSFGSLGRSVMPIIIVLLVGYLGEAGALSIVAAELFISSLIIYVGLGFVNRKAAAVKEYVAKKAAATKHNIKRSNGYLMSLLPLLSIIFVKAMFMASTTTFVPEYLLTGLHSELEVGGLLTFSFVFAIAGQLVFGYFTTRFGGRKVIAATTTLSSIAFFFFLYGGDNVLIIGAAYAIFVFVTFNGFSVTLGYVGQAVPEEYINRANSFIWGFGQILGSAAGVLLFTLLLNFIKIDLAMWIMLAVAVAAVVMLPLLLVGNRGRKNL
ncbi:MAG: MFS transporter [Candidatus Micrarchaeales archaeon]|jgi:MFS family permease|nr:MFS transporter [Candidatus Micrarchaeales archaeon]